MPYAGQECVSVRWVNKVKVVEGMRTVKSRLVARGFEECSDNIKKDSPTCAKESLRLSLALIASRKWKLRSIDIKAAFLQGKKMEREVHLIPPPEACEREDYVWKLNTCIYGLTDASRTWYLSVKAFLNNIGVYECRFDPCIFRCYDAKGNLCGILCTHVDDFLFAGTSGFINNVIEPLKRKFSIRTEAAGAFEYLGLRVVQNDDFSITVDQIEYVESMEEIFIDPSRKSAKDEPLSKKEKRSLRSLIGQLGWVSGQTRPDLAFDYCDLSSRVKTATVKDLFHANKVVAKAKSEHTVLTYPSFDKFETLRVVTYNDASLGNLRGGGSQGGFVSFLADEGNMCAPVMWQSRKLKRVVKSAMAAETLECYTDSNQLYDAVYSLKLIEDKRLRIDMGLLQEMIARQEISKIVWVDKTQQLADSLTKLGASSRTLLHVFASGVLVGR